MCIICGVGYFVIVCTFVAFGVECLDNQEANKRENTNVLGSLRMLCLVI